MGALTLPASGSVYLDANGFIYTVESIEPYRALLDMVWQAARAGQIKVITSELTLLEVLVMPLKVGNAAVAATFRSVVLKSPDVQAAPITRAVLEAAAHLRATVGLKTPDAIHAATALRAGAELFITNDSAFRRVSGLAVVVLSDLDLPTA